MDYQREIDMILFLHPCPVEENCWIREVTMGELYGKGGYKGNGNKPVMFLKSVKLKNIKS